MLKPTLPPWLKQGVFAASGDLIFAVARVQATKPPRPELRLRDALGNVYPLSGCHQAAPQDCLTASAFIDQHGHYCQLWQQGGCVVLADATGQRRIQLPQQQVELAVAVQVFAAAFGGEVIHDLEIEP